MNKTTPPTPEPSAEAHFNRLSPAEAERLALLAEEAGEVIQIVGKILRHGFESKHPDGGPTNRDLLVCEIGDFNAAVSIMSSSGDFSRSDLHDAAQAKLKKVFRYLHHQRGRPTP